MFVTLELVRMLYKRVTRFVIYKNHYKHRKSNKTAEKLSKYKRFVKVYKFTSSQVTKIIHRKFFLVIRSKIKAETKW